MKCPVCGKKFDVLWPNQWAYKDGKKFLCSYGCMRRMERGEKDMEKFTKEQRQEAIRIALDGGDVKGYLKSIGSTSPENLWYYMKTQLRKKDPETWEKLKKMDVKKVVAKPVPAKKIVETPEGEFAPATVKLDGPIRIETPEKIYDIPKPVKPSALKYKVTGIATEVGEFWIVSGGKIKWIPGPLGKEDPVLQVMMTTTEPALTPDMWRQFTKIILDVMDLLEVES